jgi:hypothetical protein
VLEISESVVCTCQAFIFELGQGIGTNLSLDLLCITQPSIQKEMPTSAASSQTPFVLETVQEMTSQAFQAKKLGFAVGCHVANKHDKVINIFEITTINDEDGATLVDSAHNKTVVAVETLLQHWRVHKGRVAEQVHVTDAAKPHVNESWGIDIVRGVIGMAIRAEFVKSDIFGKVSVHVNPNTVKTVSPVKAGTLRIVAASQRLGHKTGTNYIPLGTFSVAGDKPWWLQPHIALPMTKAGESKNPFVSPFWFVKNEDNPKAANMVFEWVAVKIAEFTVHVPTMVNKKDLQAGDELTWCAKTCNKPPRDCADGKKPRRA